jgi:UDP-N-acetyl-D-galactosamine dehydrogenase
MVFKLPFLILGQILPKCNKVPQATFDAVVLGVAHREFLDLDINALRNNCSILYDVKGVLVDDVDGKL